MVTVLLLMIIYLTFISLGLPDAIFGVAWPLMRADFGMSLDSAGLISITTTLATILSSIFSGYFIKRFGTFYVTLFSVLLTIIGLVGISLIPSFYWILLFAFPLGFGAGSIDTALNNYVAVHFKAIHMNFLHAFWGIGATLGPIIMTTTLSLNYSWRRGYLTLAIIQSIFLFFIFISLPLWRKHKEENNIKETNEEISYKTIFKIKGVYFSLLTFIIYCAIEFSIGLWGASYLVSVQTIVASSTGIFIGIYYGGITVGRLLSGVISFKLSNRQMIKYGIILFTISSLMFLFDLPVYLLYFGFFLQGMGLAPIFPAMTHETPIRFGKDKSQHIIGYQMASAYIGASIFPAFFGVFANLINLTIYPYYLIALGLLLFYITQTLNKQTKKRL